MSGASASRRRPPSAWASPAAARALRRRRWRRCACRSDPMPRRSLPFSHPATWLSTWFGCGLSPVGPGSVGSLAALPLAALTVWLGGTLALQMVSAALLAIGIAASDVYARLTGVKDPDEVVIDEVAGQCLTLLVVPLAPLPYVVGFLLFRFFDVAKPF